MRNSPKPASLAIDTIAPAAPFDHPGQHGPGGVERRQHVEPPGLLPSLGRQVEEERGRAVPADVVDEDGDRAEVGADRRRRRPAVAAVSVRSTAYTATPPAGGGDLGGGAVGHLLVAVEDRDDCPLAGEDVADGPADVRRAAGHDGDPICSSPRSIRAPVVWSIGVARLSRRIRSGTRAWGAARSLSTRRDRLAGHPQPAVGAATQP